MKILVTGGAGFIGSHIAESFVKKGYEIIILDDLSSGKKENIPKNAKFINVSVTNKKDLKKAIKGVDYVFHLAAMVSVPRSFENPKECYQINTEGTRNVLEAALKEGVKKVIFSSSAAVYGDNKNLPLKENEDCNPLSPYGVSKMQGEKLCLEYSKKGLKTCALRYFNVYGPRQDPKSPYSGVISIFIDRAKNNKKIIIYGDGGQTRDFVHVSDVVLANVLAMEKCEGIMNVASGTEVTIKGIAQKIIKLCASKSKITYKNAREGDIKRSLADITKIKKEGFIPKTKLDEGLKTLL